MTSDINITAATVVAIQGEAISTTPPTDGYVLMWNSSGDGYWEPRPMPAPAATGLRKEYFTSSGTWTCPAGIYNIIIVASAGGWGGKGGWIAVYQNEGGPGAAQGIGYLSVTPNITYDIVIGQGGNGGIGMYQSNPPYVNTTYTNGQPGGPTTFSDGGTLLFRTTSDITTPSITNICSNGNTGSSPHGGLGGGAGTNGNGANGGAGNVATTSTPTFASNGSNAAANTGAGGGAGGSCDVITGTYTCTAGNGGAGGSGYMYILY